uniref:Uncharacterized protein n=1 Tax=Setaria italica TaxID=4555 RepID=K3Y3U6_SETIT
MSVETVGEDTAEAMVAVVMRITAMAMGTAGLHLPCIPTGRVGTTLPTGILETTLPTGTTPRTGGTRETTMRAGVGAGTPRLLMVGAGQEGSDQFRRIGCQREATVVAAVRVEAAMIGKMFLALHITMETVCQRWMAMACCCDGGGPASRDSG